MIKNASLIQQEWLQSDSLPEEPVIPLGSVDIEAPSEQIIECILVPVLVVFSKNITPLLQGPCTNKYPVDGFLAVPDSLSSPRSYSVQCSNTGQMREPPCLK